MNPEVLVRPEQDSGVPGGAALPAYADAIIGPDEKPQMRPTGARHEYNHLPGSNLASGAALAST